MSSEKWKRYEDIVSIEDPLERLLAQRLKLIYSKGKWKKRVLTLFTDEVNKGLNILVKNRSPVGVNNHSIYLFPCITRNSKNHIRGWEVVHDTGSKVSLEKPNSITYTKNRTNMTTVLQLLDMNNA